MEETINRTAIIILILWISMVIFFGLVENLRLPVPIQESKTGLDILTPKMRRKIIEIDLDEIY